MSDFRIKIPNGIYHCMSRLVCWAPEFDAYAKQVFINQMRRQALFCGVDVITYCVMNNHFHILLRVPDRPSGGVTDALLLQRYRALYGKKAIKGRYGDALSPDALEGVLARDDAYADQARAQLLARMHDVSSFMRELKQRFSIWYNHRHERHGTLWSERFKSVLVEGRPAALKVVSAYIDLNPVRTGLVADPKDYLWSGYGAACGGESYAVSGLVWLMEGDNETLKERSRCLANYRMMLYGKGALPGAGGKNHCLNPEAARKVMQAGGRLSLSEVLLCRSRPICHGIIFGGRDFVARFGEFRRKRLQRKRRCKPVAFVAGGEGNCFALR